MLDWWLLLATASSLAGADLLAGAEAFTLLGVAEAFTILGDAEAFTILGDVEEFTILGDAEAFKLLEPEGKDTDGAGYLGKHPEDALGACV